MTFAEKLIFLMNLTSVSNKQLAEAIKVDPSLISLLRTARRNAPKNIAHTKAMANYFSKRCGENYQRIALSEALGRKYLRQQMDADQLSAILFDWLTDRRDQVGQFLNTFERFSFDQPQPQEADAAVEGSSKNSLNNFAYYGNEGKRGAVEAFVTHLLSLSEPGTILFSTDENLDWLFEDPAYQTRLQEQMMLLMQRGFCVRRITSPFYAVDQAFSSLSRWLPLYMTGQVESFYYPRLRDNVYRRTLIVHPDTAAVISTSAGDQTFSRTTLFTLDQRIANSFAGEFQDYLEKCRPMTVTYSMAKHPEELLRCISQFESDKGDRIQQSSSLSAITTPPELIRRVVNSSSNEETSAIINTLLQAQTLFCQSLSDYQAVDIHCLATVKEIKGGAVPISAAYLLKGSKAYYTPETYALHLKNILAYMEQYENYHAVIRPRDTQTHALMVKEGRQVLLLRPTDPLTIFEISQPYIEEACREYLTRLIEAPFSATTQRKDTILKLRQMICELEMD